MREPEDRPKIFKWWRAFQGYNLPDFTFCPGELADKSFPHVG